MTGQQLRNSILQEAIQGRLVPNVLQPGEKTGAELLQDILAERQKKENQEKGKKAKKLSLSIIEEEPWELPEGWCWCRLEDLCQTIGGKDNQIKSTQVKENGQYPVVSQGQSLIDGYYDDKSKVVLSVPVIIFGDHTKNVKYIDFPFIVGADGTKILKPFNGIYEKWFYYVVLYFAKIVLYDRGYARHFSLLCKESIPLPPLSIQKAIVEKIEALFPLVDEYDKAAGELKALNEILPDKLRKSVLQEAIHGNLVPNEIPEGEATAQELLQQILKERQDKENAVKGKKASKINLSEIETTPWDIPDGWCWCRIEDICYVASGSTPDKTAFVEDGIPYLKMYNIRNQKVDFNYHPQYITVEVHQGKLKRSIARPGDLLMNIVGPPLGKLAIIPDELTECNFNQAAVMMHPYIEISTIGKYLYYYLGEMSEINTIETKGTAGQDNISLTQSKNMRVALPPLSIQKAIVEKIEEVFAAIDKLKA